MADRDDQPLVRAARSGDLRAFARLIDRHYPMLLASCARMLGERDRDLARDAAQEACLRALLGLRGLRDDTRFGAWLVGIGLNVCRGLFNPSVRHVSFDALTEAGHLGAMSAERAGPDEVIVSRELAVQVREAISGLPAGQREAVALFYIAGLTQAEAAEELGTRTGAIKTRLHKARASLRVSLHDTYREYIQMSDEEPSMIPMHVAGVRRTAPTEPGTEQHIVSLEDETGRRLPIWIGRAEATAMALVLEQVELPRPGVYQFAASLLAGAGGQLREVRITELTDSTFYAQAVLSDGTRVDARPSDALTLALVTGAPISVAASVLERSELEDRPDLDREAAEAIEAAPVIAAEARAAILGIFLGADD